MSKSDDEFNREATPLLAGAADDGTEARPGIMVGGALVLVYVEDGRLVISADFDTVTSPPFSLYGPERDQVPVEVRMTGEVVWSAGPGYAREAVYTAFNRARDAAESVAGDDMALDVIAGLGLSRYLPEGDGEVTCEQAHAAYNALANAAKEKYNPEADAYESADSIRADSCGDLVVNLAVGYLADRDASADDIIADAWSGLDLPGFPEYDEWAAKRYPGDGDVRPQYDSARREAIVAEVESWF